MKPKHTTHDAREMGESHYPRLVAMTAFSFLAMYMLMYAMVNALSNVYPNFNQGYMAGLMTAAMVILELLFMGSMYPRKKLNAAILAGSVVALIGCWLLIRQQTSISDRQFMKSMIPHHAGAILMCQRAAIRHAEIRALCQGIVTSQQAEIDQMKALLNVVAE